MARLSDSVAEALDCARSVLEDIGIRSYRTFLVVESWSGASVGEGAVTRSFEEIHPAPKVRGASGAQEQGSGGARLVGGVSLEKISRLRYSREQLKGLLPDGTRRPTNESFRIALMPRGQVLAQLYVPGDPQPGKDEGWTLRLEPTGQPIPHTAEPIEHDTMAELAVGPIDTSRQILTDLGLREYRVYLVTETWSGAARGDGTRTLAFSEIEPSPRARFVSDREEMMSGGRRHVGDAVLERISRSMTREMLRGKNPGGSSRPSNESFYWGIQDAGANGLVQLYKVGGEPVLSAFGWEITLTPTSIRESRP